MRYPIYFLNKDGNEVARISKDVSDDGTPRYNINPKWFVNVRSSNSFMTIRPNRVKQAIYYNNIIARTFNKGYYNNILEITLGYRIKPKKSKSESK